MKNKIIAFVLATCTVLSVFSGLFSTAMLSAFAKTDTIDIKSKEDFLEFSKNCTLDSDSFGKTVNLLSNIEFSKDEFVPVPIFNGTFNGNGYVISGINYREKGSYKGIFRYVGQNGKVSDLNVKGDFTPSGSKSFIGGIVGENYGCIENCSFEGKVSGENVIGGIAGNNTEYGRILSCVSSGNVSGENSCGGIAGKNSGFIQNCVNNSAVNTVYEEKKSNVSDIDADGGSIAENYKNSVEENKEESLLGHSDAGGIVGYTSGTVKGCENRGEVGYKHVGYNIGGIAGRQSGYMIGCENHGAVKGRKDVGGIVGQAEPYTLLDASESMLGDLKKETDKLNSLINKFISDADNLGDDVKEYSDKISFEAKRANEFTQTLIDYGIDFTDGNLDEINAQAAILSNTLDKLTPAFESLENGCKDLAEALDDMSEAFDGIKIYVPELGEETDDVNSALEKLSSAEEYLKNAVKKFNRAKDDLDDAIEFKNIEKVKTALAQMSESIKAMISAKRKIRQSLENIESILQTKPDDFETVGINVKKILENIKIIKENNEIIITSLQRTGNGIDTIILNTEIDLSEFVKAAERIDMAIGYMMAAIGETNEGIRELGAAAEDIYDILKNYTDDVSEDLNTAKDNISKSFKLLSYAAEDIEKAMGDIKDIVSDLANEKTAEFVKLGDDFKNTSVNLFDALSEMGDGIDGLKDSISSQKGKINNDLRAIADCFNSIVNIIANDNGVNSGGISNIFVDASDEDTEKVKQGKIEDCRNSGTVEADRNVGGIVGASATEYSKDPEDDIERPNALKFTYRSKAVVQSCVNEGKIVGKKDCVGGIAGFEEIGTVYKCENYGDVESTGGNYVGGVVGKSESSVRKSYAKSKVGGKDFVGGIVGKAERLTSSFAITDVKGEENFGAVCGNCADKENVYSNFFTDNGLGGIDGVSYAEKAEPIEYERLKNMSGIPKRFISFSVTFVADGKVTEKCEMEYGEDTARIKYPEIPKKDGCFGNWIKPENDKIGGDIEIVCEYKPYITILASEEKEDKKLALALCEGEFTDRARLNCTPSDRDFGAKKSDNVKIYDITLSNTDINDDDAMTARILNKNKDKVTAYIFSDSEWKKTKTTERGKYTVMDLKGAKNTVCLKYEKRSVNFAAMLFLPLAAVAVFAIKRKKR